MSDSTTTNYGWAYPTVNGDSDSWGTTINDAFIAADVSLKTVEDAGCKAANNGSDFSSASDVRSNLGLTIGTNVQAWTGRLQSLSDADGVAGTVPYWATTGVIGPMTISSGLTLSAGTLTADVTSVAGRTGAVTLSHSDISGLGTAATVDVTGTGYPITVTKASTTNNLPAYNSDGSIGDSAIAFTNVPLLSNNLSDMTAATCRTNLGLGSIATKAITVSTSDPSGTPGDGDLWFKYTA